MGAATESRPVICVCAIVLGRRDGNDLVIKTDAHILHKLNCALYRRRGRHIGKAHRQRLRTDEKSLSIARKDKLEPQGFTTRQSFVLCHNQTPISAGRGVDIGIHLNRAVVVLHI